MKSLLLLTLLFVAITANYAGYKVVRAYIENEQQIAEINKWELDVWTRESTLNIGWNDIVVNDNHMVELLKLEVPFDIIIKDLDTHLEEGQKEHQESRRDTNAMLTDFFSAYYSYDEIAEYLSNLTSVYSSISNFIPSIGTTFEGRNIFGVKITGPGAGTKKQIIVIAGQHAREWIAPATTVYIITQLIEQYSTNPAVQILVDNTIFHFFPLVNPDGYEYTRQTDRLWRKNRRSNSGSFSRGVDLNRNWNDHWGGDGASSNPASDIYAGTAPFSEPETYSLSTYVTANGPFVGAIDYHSYDQLILRPHGWTSTPPSNDLTVKIVADVMSTYIIAEGGATYTSEPAWQQYYTTGTALDWFKSQANIRFCYSIGLRDKGNYGYILPISQIIPTGAENWVAFVYFAQTVTVY